MVNYFELYGIPESFTPDAAAVKTKYYELSRKYHPDRFAQADGATRAEALRMAAMNNDAYKMLNNEGAVMAYILRLHGLLEHEEKYALPSAFLMEMMELNEVISEYELEPGNDILKQQAIQTLADQLEQWNAEVSPLTEKFDAAAPDKELLLRIKDYYFRKKYLLRIQERINTFAAH
jgi:molecular chaperone HscB